MQNRLEYFKASRVLIQNKDSLTFHVQTSIEFTEIYIVSLLYLDCSCPDYIYEARPCKHVYACIYFYLDMKKVKINIQKVNDNFYLLSLFKSIAFTSDSREIELQGKCLYPIVKNSGKPLGRLP